MRLQSVEHSISHLLRICNIQIKTNKKYFRFQTQIVTKEKSWVNNEQFIEYSYSDK